MDSVTEWSGLFSDLLTEIATKLSLIEDFTAFRGVCTSWRAAATKDRFVSVSKVPLLMLSEKSEDGDVREFYSLSKKKIFSRISMPKAMRKKMCIDAGFGWILTTEISSGQELSLVKPMSSAIIQLPNIASENSFISCAVLSTNPSKTSDFVLSVVANLDLYFWRSGDSHWKMLERKKSTHDDEHPPEVANVFYYKHKMYAVDYTWNMWMWDPYLPQAPAEIILTYHEEEWWLHCDDLVRVYLVESSKGELLLIMRGKVVSCSSDYLSSALYFHIVQIDTVKRTYSVIEHLDQDAVFIGLNLAVSVDAADFPGVIKANHVYYTDDIWEEWFNSVNGGGKDMRIYNIEDKSIERFDVESFSFICPPLWIFPSLL